MPKNYPLFSEIIWIRQHKIPFYISCTSYYRCSFMKRTKTKQTKYKTTATPPNPKTMSSLDGGLEAIFLWPIWEFHLRNNIELISIQKDLIKIKYKIKYAFVCSTKSSATKQLRAATTGAKCHVYHARVSVAARDMWSPHRPGWYTDNRWERDWSDWSDCGDVIRGWIYHE